MTPDDFIQEFGLLADAPNGIQKLREMVLQLAVQGKLVPQNPIDGTAAELLKRIATEKLQLATAMGSRKVKPLRSITENDLLFDIPDAWQWVLLGGLGYTQTGTTPNKGDSESYGSDYPFIKPADITANSVDYDNEGLSKKGVERYGRLAKAGSCLMVCIGTIGKCNIINRDCSFNQQINAITPVESVDPFYLRWALMSPYFQTEAWYRSSRTTLSILNKGRWEQIPIPFPPLAEQKRIVDKVDELMRLCDKVETTLKQSRAASEKLIASVVNHLTKAA